MCPNECSATILHKEIDEHLTDHCIHRVTRCRFCNQAYKVNEEQVGIFVSFPFQAVSNINSDIIYDA